VEEMGGYRSGGDYYAESAHLRQWSGCSTWQGTRLAQGSPQGQSFVVATNPELKEEIAQLCGVEYYVEMGFHSWISEAPVLFIPCTSKEAYHRRYHQEPDKMREDGVEIEWAIPFWYMDAGCSVQILLMAALDEGLAAGFAGLQDFDGLRSLLGIPEEVTPVGVIPVGHRAPDVPSPSLKRGRKPQEQYAHWERW
jgi:nitroreductase